MYNIYSYSILEKKAVRMKTLLPTILLLGGVLCSFAQADTYYNCEYKVLTVGRNGRNWSVQVYSKNGNETIKRSITMPLVEISHACMHAGAPACM